MSPQLDRAALEELVLFACRLAELAGRAILPHFRNLESIDNKQPADFDPVTAADREAERVIRDEILRVYPRHGIVGEEFGSTRGSEPFTWMIDPIDGTRAFIAGLLHWGVLVALNDGARPIVGAMHQPYTRETFFGTRDGAQMRRESQSMPLQVRKIERIQDAILSATDPAMFANGPERDAFRSLAATVKMRRYGGDCYAYAMLAAGHIDLVVEASLNPYDIQALIPIIEGAGGIVTSWVGGDASHGGRVIAAGDERIHAAALEILKRAPLDS
jgi:myo-inositol-1(or 4)-monophosphatase